MLGDVFGVRGRWYGFRGGLSRLGPPGVPIGVGHRRLDSRLRGNDVGGCGNDESVGWDDVGVRRARAGGFPPSRE